MANTYKALSTVTVGAGGAASITFSSIPQTYTDLLVKISGRTNWSNALNSDGVLIYPNGSTSNMTAIRLLGSGSAASSDDNTGPITVANASATASTFGNAELYIPNYVSENNKSISVDGVSESNSSQVWMSLDSLKWSNTSAITSLQIAGQNGSFVEYSTFTLYGVFNADVSSAPATPTIGTATAGNTQASITFTGVSNAASYTMTSTPSSITATGTTSPITVTGLTNETAYTFKVKSNNPFGSSAESAASNSVTPSAASFYSIASATITDNSTNSITFSGIPSTYSHLQLRAFITSVNDSQYYGMRFNGVSSGSLYVDQGVGGRQTDTMESWSYPNENAFALVGRGNGTNPTFPGIAIVDIMDYTDTTKFKTTRGMNTVTRTSTGETYLRSGVFMSTNAVSSITIYNASSGYFMTGNKIMLFGIKGS